MGRGLERRDIFDDTPDKQEFLRRLGLALDQAQSQCLAWALMPNHYHLLIRVGPLPLSKLMSPLLGGYGSYYNRRHERSGYVFQNRFKSIFCDERRYLLELVRYIHLNPVRAGLLTSLESLDNYPWTGHAGLMGRHRRFWHEVDEVLLLFSSQRHAARERYRDYLHHGLVSPSRINYAGGGLIRSHGGWESTTKVRSEHSRIIGDERILGSSEFVEAALAQDKLRLKTATLRQREGWDLEALIRSVCRFCQLHEDQLLTRARANQLALAKSLVCYWSVEELELPLAVVGRRLAISQQAVSKWVRQGRSRCSKENIQFEHLGRLSC